MGDRYLVGAKLIDAAAFEAARSFNDPQVFSQVAIVQIDAELLRPECIERVEVVDVLAGIAVMPAIDEAHDLRAPGPVAARMHLRIHGGLHLSSDSPPGSTTGHYPPRRPADRARPE